VIAAGKSASTRGKIREHPRLARLRHAALLDFREVAREQREAVRVVAEQVAFDEDLGDGPGLLRFESCAR
jgi:hypothetical protein